MEVTGRITFRANGAFSVSFFLNEDNNDGNIDIHPTTGGLYRVMFDQGWTTTMDHCMIVIIWCRGRIYNRIGPGRNLVENVVDGRMYYMYPTVFYYSESDTVVEEVSIDDDGTYGVCVNWDGNIDKNIHGPD